MAAGRIGEALEVPGATLSFHLKELARAGLVSSRQEKQFIYYAVGLRAHGRAHDFSHAKLLSGNAAGVSHGCRDGAGSLLPASSEIQ